MSSKFDNFVAALEALCVEHRVELTTTMYDGLAVFDRDTHSSTLTDARIDDETAQDK